MSDRLYGVLSSSRRLKFQLASPDVNILANLCCRYMGLSHYQKMQERMASKPENSYTDSNPINEICIYYIAKAINT